MSISLTKRLEAMSRSMGIDVFGVADAAGFLDEGYKGNRPQDIMPSVRSVIVIGVQVPRGSLDPLPKGRPEYTNTLLAGTVVLRAAAFRLARSLEDEGHIASIVPTEGSEFGYWYADKVTLKADVSIKYAGYLAGLGNYGINHLLRLPGLGPRVRLTAILTDADLDHGTSMNDLVDSECKGCLNCVNACPVGALHEDGSIEPQKCRDYMFNVLGGLRCGLCVKACPNEPVRRHAR